MIICDYRWELDALNLLPTTLNKRTTTRLSGDLKLCIESGRITPSYTMYNETESEYGSEIFDLYLKEEIIGKAFVNRFDLECDGGPCIEFFEIKKGKELRRMGYGTKLLCEVEKFYKKHGYDKLFVMFVMNEIALRFFIQNGYPLDENTDTGYKIL